MGAKKSLSLSQPQPTSTTTPAEPFRDVIHQDLKHLGTSSWKWKNAMPHSNSPQQSSHPQQSMECQTKKIAVFNVNNQDASLDIALTLGMNVMNTVISSWTAHTKYPLLEHQHHITRHTNVTMPDQAWVTIGKT